MDSSHQKVLETIARDIRSRRFQQRFSWRRFGLWMGSVVIFSLISFIALVVSLGYKVDYANGTLQQTSLVEIDGPVENVPLQVLLNGQVMAGQLPAKISGLQPGDYTITVKRDGYAPWQQNISLAPNQRVVLPNVFLTYAKITPHAVASIAINDSRFNNQDTHDIQIQNENELWVNGKFITRTTDNLYNAQWLPGYNLITVQAGPQILLIDPSIDATTQEQTFVMLPTNEVVSYFFLNDGQQLVYRTQKQVEQMELFESVGFFNFLY